METDPFPSLKISSSDWLNDLHGRSTCPRCDRSRKYFCYTCFLPVREIQDNIPRVKLPLKVDIIKHPSEVDGKSTAAHAAILAPDHVTVYTYPSIPAYTRPDEVLLAFPGEGSISLSQVADKVGTARLKTPCVSNCCAFNAATIELESRSISRDVTKRGGEHCYSSKRRPNVNCNHGNRKDEQSVNCDRNGDQSDNLNRKCEHENCIKNEHYDDCDGTKDSVTDGNHGKPCTDTCSHGIGHSKMVEKVNGLTIVEDIAHLTEMGEAKEHKNYDYVCSSCVRVEQLEIFQELCTCDDSQCHEKTDIQSCQMKDVSASLPFHTIVFIDSTWNQTKKIADDERLSGLTCVEIQNRETKFWRHQRYNPRTYLSTVEAIYFFFREFHDLFIPCQYDAQYDNLLFFFKFIYKKLSNLPGGREPKAYELRRQTEKSPPHRDRLSEQSSKSSQCTKKVD